MIDQLTITDADLAGAARDFGAAADRYDHLSAAHRAALQGVGRPDPDAMGDAAADLWATRERLADLLIAAGETAVEYGGRTFRLFSGHQHDYFDPDGPPRGPAEVRWL